MEKQPPRKLRLSDITVKNAKGEARVYNLWDAKQHGLCLRVQPTGGKSWYAVYSRQGRPRWLHLGDARDLGLADARTMAAEMLLAVVKGADPAAERRAKRGDGTFADLAARYVEQHAKRHNKSWRQADALIRRFALPRWGILLASSIARRDVKALAASIDKPSVATQTVRAVSAVYSWAVKDELLSANPCRAVAEHVTVDRERVLAESELAPFWQAIDDLDDRPAGLALRMTLLTGQRPGEIAHMRIEHVKDGWWQLPGAPVPELGWFGTKNGESHRVWFSAPARSILDELVDDDAAAGFVFANSRGGPQHKLRNAMRDLCTTIEIERATPHDLRRTFGTLVTGLGFARSAMDRILNHADGGVGSIYDRHGYADEDRRIMETVASRIMGLVEGRDDGKVVQFSNPR